MGRKAIYLYCVGGGRQTILECAPGMTDHQIMMAISAGWQIADAFIAVANQNPLMN